MTPTLECILIVLVVIGVAIVSYSMGRLDGIREVRHLLEEAYADYDEFRDGVFEELGIELEGRDT